MNIQIFGSSKCFDTKKAERWFKERRVKYQYIDQKGLLPGGVPLHPAEAGLPAAGEHEVQSLSGFIHGVYHPRRGGG